MMVLIAGISFLAGAVLGLRFKVLVLVPAMLVVVLAGVATIDSFDGLWSLALRVVVAVTALQVGYLIGGFASPIFELESDQPESRARRSSDALRNPLRSRR